ncbi:MAG TPA: TSUP family transporter [Sediminibacterium sp.]|nr:TSUP family transporter [Sediminibacterium sp.]
MLFSPLLLLCCCAFAAGFVDAVVGGGGLIQTPASLVLLPQLPVATVIGSLKIPSFTGTLFATFQYSRKVRFYTKQLLLMIPLAFIAAFTGSELLTHISDRWIKPVLLVVLAGVAIYTYTNKKFGQHTIKEVDENRRWIYVTLISLGMGLYDGCIGPGAGSFLILAFISVLGWDFLHASAHAKLLNLATNAGSILLFLLKGTILWKFAIPMAICNGIGGVAGARIAIARGNRFIRYFFLAVVLATLLRFAWEVFFKG